MNSPRQLSLREPGFTQSWGLFRALWQRDLLRLVKERSRWIGVVLQPLLFWVVLGSGMGSVFRVQGLENVDYAHFFFPGIVAMVILFTAIFATMSVIEDRQTGFLQQALVVPGSRTALVLGKIAGVTTVAVLQAVLCVFAAPLAGYDLLACNWPYLLAALTLGSCLLTAMNFVMAWIISSTAGYHGIMSVVLMPMWMLSGAMYPAASGWTKVAMQLNPMAYLVDATRHGLSGGQALAALTTPASALLILLAMTFPAVAFAVLTVRRKIEKGRA